MKVQAALDNLWAGVVNDYVFDILKRRVIFEVTVFDGDSEKCHRLEFNGVSSFYFVNADGEGRYNIPTLEEGDYVELTSIHYLEEGLGTISAKVTSQDWVGHHFPSNPNLCIEVWSSWLLVEASNIRVNDLSFDLGN
ncbi:MAG: YxiG family protein [Bacilli bacterium]